MCRYVTRFPLGIAFFFGEKAVQSLLDASVGVESVKYKMLSDLLLSTNMLELNATVLFWWVAFAS